MTITKGFEGTVYSEKPTEQKTSEVRTDYRNSTYTIVSTVGYLVGVPKQYFDPGLGMLSLELFDQLDKDKNARIIRNLSMLRTAIELNYGEANYRIYHDLKNLHTMPDLIPQECLMQLEADGISIIKANCKLNQYIIDINRHIANRINNCQKLFHWLKWDYLRDLFIMPNGLTEAGIKAAAAEYYANKSRYPYQVYINWSYGNHGNILFNDKKFATLLYEANEDCFTDLSKVTDASDLTKESIYDFLEDSDRTVVMVDCENSDPYKLYAMLNNLDQQALLDRIYKIILCDDVNTTTAWDILERFTDIPVEHLEIERVSNRKSIVDQALSVQAVIEHFENDADSIMLFSSDSDYWGLYGRLKKVHYYVMVENGKFGADNRNALMEAGIPFCYIDDFCTGNSNKIKTDAMQREITKFLEEAVSFNVHDMLRNAYLATRAEMSDAEKKQFYDRYIKNMRLVIDKDGNVSVALGQ